GRATNLGSLEPNCRLEWRLHTHREAQVSPVAERDGLKCWGGGEKPEKWLRGPESYIGWGRGDESPSYATPLAMMQHGTRYCTIERVTALELEHTRPLWSVTHLPD